jgi:GNAT superfamily N-acetyltransferase
MFMTHPAPNYELSNTRSVDPAAIQSLRQSVGWEADDAATWEEQLEKAKAVRSVSYDGELVGIGFLIGLKRHAVVADVCVNPEYQRQGIGHRIVASLVEEAQTVKYVTLTYNEATPDLQAFYEKHEFAPVSNAMQLRDEFHLT